jgi:hypothetical protein
MTDYKSREADPMNDNVIVDFNSMSWDQLERLLPDLPESMCMRSIYLIDLVEDGLCSEEVKEEIEEHRSECRACQNGLTLTRGLRDVVVHYTEQTVAYDAQESFDDLLSSRWDELELEQLLSTDRGSDQDPVMDGSGVRSAQMSVEGPHKKRSRRMRTGLLVAAAAAIFFAYGRPLIEGEVDTPEFPSADQVSVESHQSPRVGAAPLRSLLQREHSYRFELKSIHPIDSTSLWWVYQVKTPSSEGGVGSVELRSRAVSKDQADALSAQYFKSVQAGHGVSLTRAKGVVQVKTTSTPQLEVAEYVLDNYLYQWSARGGEGDRQSLIQEIVRAHLDERGR